MHINRHHIREGLKFLVRRLQDKPFKKYEGNASEICRQSIEDNWTGDYFTCGTGNHTIIYVRDLGISSASLVATGYQNEVQKSLEHMLTIFKRHGSITTTIDQKGHAFDSFEYGIDSVPLIIHALRVSESFDLIRSNLEFLNDEVLRFSSVLKNGLVSDERTFSTLKDSSKRPSSAYDNSTAALLRNELELLAEEGFLIGEKLPNVGQNMEKAFWNGQYLRDYLHADDYVASDANTFPYFFGAITDKKMMRSSLDSIINEELNIPIPLKWTAERHKETEHGPIRFSAKNYQGTTAWTILAGVYLQVLAKNKHPAFKEEVTTVKELLERDGTCIELYEGDRPYRRAFYKSDEAMLWSALIYDVLENKLSQSPNENV